MRVGIVGAGIAGLAAARALRAAGQEVILFEKALQVGGRVATKRIGPYIFDTGATSVAPRGLRIEKVMTQELDQSALARVEKQVYVHAYGRISPGERNRNRIARYVYEGGLVRLPELLAQGLNVRFGAKVDHLEPVNEEAFCILGETFDAVILTPPIPESTKLLESIGEGRSFANANYRACLSVLLAYDQPLEGLNYFAVVDPDQRNPLTWLSIESSKCSGYAPPGHTAMVAQMSPVLSFSLFDAESDRIIQEALTIIERFYGKRFNHPVETDVVRWRYAQPETTALFDSVNQVGSRLLVASDGVYGARVEFAYEAGLRAAELLLSNG